MSEPFLNFGDVRLVIESIGGGGGPEGVRDILKLGEV
jgi:hypothetical protein